MFSTLQMSHLVQDKPCDFVGPFR